nr:conserved hypothetical protein [Hymenolepis microstoma]
MGSLPFVLATQAVVVCCLLQKSWTIGLPRDRFRLSLAALIITDLLLNLSHLLLTSSFYTHHFHVLGCLLQGNYHLLLLSIDTLQILNVQIHLFVYLEYYGLTPKKLQSYSGLTLLTSLALEVFTPLTFPKPSETLHHSSFTEYRMDAIALNALHRLHCYHIRPVIVLGAILLDQRKQTHYHPLFSSNSSLPNADTDFREVVTNFISQSMAADFFQCAAIILLYQSPLPVYFNTYTNVNTILTYNRQMSNSILLYGCIHIDIRLLSQGYASETPLKETDPTHLGDDNTNSLISTVE